MKMKLIASPVDGIRGFGGFGGFVSLLFSILASLLNHKIGPSETHETHETHTWEISLRLWKEHWRRQATEARRTMRQMDKSYRPEIAGELERTPENLAYGQLTRANKQMRAISREIARVAWAKSLPDVQRLIQDRARATRRPGLMGELRGKGAWEDIGALKAWLRDNLVGERNRYAREVVKDVKARRRETEARP